MREIRENYWEKNLRIDFDVQACIYQFEEHRCSRVTVKKGEDLARVDN